MSVVIDVNSLEWRQLITCQPTADLIYPILSKPESIANSHPYVTDVVYGMNWNQPNVQFMPEGLVEQAWQADSNWFMPSLGHCAVCDGLLHHSDKGAWEVQHVVPPRMGGSHQLDNLVIMCSGCSTAHRGQMPFSIESWERHLYARHNHYRRAVGMALVVASGLMMGPNTAVWLGGGYLLYELL